MVTQVEEGLLLRNALQAHPTGEFCDVGLKSLALNDIDRLFVSLLGRLLVHHLVVGIQLHVHLALLGNRSISEVRIGEHHIADVDLQGHGSRVDVWLSVERQAEVETRRNRLALNRFRKNATVCAKGNVVGHLAEAVDVGLPLRQLTILRSHRHKNLDATAVGTDKGGIGHGHHFGSLLHRLQVVVSQQVGDMERHKAIISGDIEVVVGRFRQLHQREYPWYGHTTLVAAVVAQRLDVAAEVADECRLRVRRDAPKEPFSRLHLQMQLLLFIDIDD